jgi:hypothetical protein
MSIATVTNASVTVAAGPRGYAEYDRYTSQRISESGRRIGIQDLINEAPRPSEHYNHYRHHNSEFSRCSLSPPQLPLPLPQQGQSQQHLMPTHSSMELNSYKLPTPLTSPTAVPVTSPSLAPIQSYSPTHSTASITSKSSDDQTSYMTTIQTSGMIMPLSLQERRERNKIASAKYRAKKHRQNQEMSSTIAELSAENNVLLRQLEEIRTENLELKELVDKLKSKLVEGKILKRLGRGGAKLTLSPTSTADDDLDITCNSSLSANIRKNSTKRGGFSGHAKGTGPSTKSARK